MAEYVPHVKQTSKAARQGVIIANDRPRRLFHNLGVPSVRRGLKQRAQRLSKERFKISYGLTERVHRHIVSKNIPQRYRTALERELYEFQVSGDCINNQYYGGN